MTPVTYDNLSRGLARNVRWGPFESGDLADHQRLQAVLETYRPRAVIHMAALAYVAESVVKPDLYYLNNVGGSIRLLDAMRKTGTDTLVFSSSCAVYGDPGVKPVDETAPFAPISPYGRSKAMVEQMLSDYRAAFGLRFVSLRYFNVGGADAADNLGECHDPEPHIIPCALAAAAGQRPGLEINGRNYPTRDGTCERDYLHVRDLADAHVSALRYALERGPRNAFNLGCGRSVSLLELVDMVRRITGRTLEVIFKERRAGDPPYLSADIASAVEHLGFQPARSTMETIVGSAWEWHRRQWGLTAQD